MLVGIDHVVLAVDNPDATASLLEEKLGLRPAEGGRHERLGTFNRLVWLGDSYLEVIGVFDRALAETSWIGRPVLDALDRGGGLATWAVAVDDLDAQLRWLPPDSGFVGPLDGERRRPDERVVRWRLAHPPTLTPTTPFLIEHDPAGAEWTPDERSARAAEEHANGGRVRLASIEVVTDAPAVAAGRLRRLLGTSAEPAGRAAVRIVLGRQECRVVLTRPRGTAGIDLLTDVPMRRRSVMVGDCEIRLGGVPVDGVAKRAVEPAGDGSAAHRDLASDV
ncbi:MAG: VOC family protein [Chloroflexota bacterium]